MPNRNVLSERVPADERGPLTGPEAYEQGARWLRLAAETAEEAMRQDGEPNEIHLRGQAILYAALGRGFMYAARVAGGAQELIAGGLISEENGEDWELVIGS